MADLSIGANYAATLNSVARGMKEVYDFATEMLSDAKARQQFLASLQQTDPKHPVMDETNITVYSTKGMDIEKTRDLLKRCNIPSTMVTNKQGELFVAVPKQFAKQANFLFGVHDKLEQTDPSTMTPENKALLKQLTSGKAPIDPNTLPQLPAPTASKYLLEGKVQAYKTTQPNSMYVQTLAMELRKAGVPLAVVTINRNQTMLMVHPRYAPKVDLIDHQLQKQPTELSHHDFIDANMGQSVVKYTNLTPAQVADFRESTRGSSIGYYVEKNGDTFTLHYPENKAHLVAPKLYESIIRNSGVKQPEIEAFAQKRSHEIQQIVSKASNGERMMFGDATNTKNCFTTDSMGLRDNNGKLVVSRNDPHYEARVYAEAMKMKAPLVKKDPSGHTMEDVFTREEIAKAQESAAKASPTKADVAAAKIATLFVQPDVTAPNHTLAEINQTVAGNMKGIANALEATGHALNAEEMSEVLKVPKEDVKELCVAINQMSDEERMQMAQSMRDTADTAIMQHVDVRTVGPHDGTRRQIEEALTEKQTTERIIDEEERFADNKRPNQDVTRDSFDGEFVDDNHDGIADRQQGAEDEQRGDEDDGYGLFGDDSDTGTPDISLGD